MDSRPQMVAATPIPPRLATSWILYRPILHCTMRMLPQLDNSFRLRLLLGNVTWNAIART